MNQRTALSLIIAAAILIGVAYASGFLPGGAPPWAAWLLALGSATMLVGAMMLGALRGGTTAARRLALPFAATWLVVFGGFALALLLPPDAAGDTLWLGLPRRAAIIIYGVGLLPLFILPIAYARTFDDMTLSDDDLQRVRDAAAELRAHRDAPE